MGKNANNPNGQYNQSANGSNYTQYPNQSQQMNGQYMNPGQYQNSQYPNSGQYQNSQYPNSQYPNSQYPNSQYQNSQYPNSQYQNSGYYQQQKGMDSKTKTFLLLGIMLGIIFFLIIIFILLVQVKDKTKMVDLMNYSSYAAYETNVRKLVVDNEEINLPQHMLNLNDYTYISLESFADVFGYKMTFDEHNRQAIVTGTDGKEVVFSQGLDSIIIKHGDDQKTEPLLTSPLLFTDGQVYVPLKSMDRVFDFKKIEWDNSSDTVNITTDGKTVVVNK